MDKTKLRPGHQLERDFASWMERTLDYSHTELNKRISPGATAYEIDVYATRRNPRSARMASVGAAVYVGLLVALLIGGYQVEQTLMQTMALFLPELSSYAALVAFACGALVYVYGMKRLETRAFVECKDYKDPVGRPLLTKWVGTMTTIGNSELRAEDREEWIFVSANGFRKPALEAAAEHGIRCFSRHGHGFVEETA